MQDFGTSRITRYTLFAVLQMMSIICPAQFVPFGFWVHGKPIDISIDDVTVIEGNNLVFTITASNPAPGDLTVDWSTQNSTAFAGTHYTSASGTATISNGTSSVTVTIASADLTTVCQNDSVFLLNLSNPSKGTIVDNQGTGTIQDNDLPELTLAAGPDVTEGTNSVAVASLSTACANSDVTFKFTAASGTATSGSDFTAQSAQTFTISSGSTSLNIPVVTLQDTVDEYTQTIALSIADPTKATITTAAASANILDDDASPSMTIGGAQMYEGESKNITVTLSTASEKIVAFDYATSGSTATGGSDFTSLSVSGQTIAAGSTTRTISVDALHDTANCEGDETYTVNFSNLVDVTFAGPNPEITIYDEDLPEVTIAAASATEGSSLSFNVSLNISCPTQAMVFDYFTVDQTAVAGTDYTSASGTITIPATQTTSSITVATLDDSTLELDEYFTLAISGFSNSKLSPSGFARGTIVSDEVSMEKTVKVATGKDQTCALSSNGRVKCWGNRTYAGYGGTNVGDAPGEMGDNLISVDFGTWDHDANSGTPEIQLKVVDAAITTDKSCAILDSGGLKCFGRASFLGYGDGSTSFGEAAGTMGNSLPYVDLGTHNKAGLVPHTALQVETLGYNKTTCVLLDTGQMKCFGSEYIDASIEGQEANLGKIGDAPNEMGDNLNYIKFGDYDHDSNSGTPNISHTVKSFALGSSGACALLDNDRIKCWGPNTDGALGLGTSTLNHHGKAANSMGNNLPYVDIGTWDHDSNPGTSEVAHTVNSISRLSYNSFCAILDNGRAKCWGWGASGGLGNGNTQNIGDGPGETGNNLAYLDLGTYDHDSNSATPEISHTIKKFATQMRGMGGGAQATCAILDDDRMKCWGNGGYNSPLPNGGADYRGDNPGEMGNNLPYADRIGTGRTVKDVGIGKYVGTNVFVLRDDNSLVGYGQNWDGSLGIESTNYITGWWHVHIDDNSRVIDLGTGRTLKKFVGGDANRTCIIASDDQLYCWGRISSGSGLMPSYSFWGHETGHMGVNLTDLPLPTGTKAVDLVMGHTETCALLDNHQLFCVGVDFELGNTPAVGDAIATQSLAGGLKIRSVDIDVDEACVQDEFFNLYCQGSLRPDSFSSLTPIDFGRNLKAVQYAVGSAYACAILNDKQLRCWGQGGNARLGSGSSANITPGPNMPVINLGTVSTPKQVEATGMNTCVLFENGGLKCFGNLPNFNTANAWDYGNSSTEVGDNNAFFNFGTGITVDSLYPATGGSSYYNHMCAKLSNNETLCWGENNHGQQGHENGTNQNRPSQFPSTMRYANLNAETVLHLETSMTHTCYLNDSHEVKCFGKGSTGALGYENYNHIGADVGSMGASLGPVHIVW